jgi:protoheme IX farnesyltransferase
MPRHRGRLADFYELTKPRMNFLVVATTAVGFYLGMARSDAVGWSRLPWTLVGTALCAAAAAVLNQLIERRYDALMPRTRNRPIPMGRISPAEAALLGVLLAIAGTTTLVLAVNALTAFLGAFTILSYVLIYTPLKRVTTLNTVIGAVPGAIPPVMGVTAAAGVLSPEALVLFAILFVWQIPHFLAIATLYKDDYAVGGFRMLPVADPDLSTTTRQAVLYAAALVPVTLLPVQFGIAGAAYFTAAVLLGLAQLSFAVSLAVSRSREDARKLFLASIVYLPMLLAFLMVGRL